MKKNKNKSGFTLVEVIVVMTIMSVILGAILNLLRPVNDAFQKAKSVANTNQVGSGLNRYIESQLRYSTNMLVLENYSGVPDVSATGTLANSSASYTDCLVIDNIQKRGTQDPSYTSTSSVSRKMGCTGTIIHVGKVNEGGLNFANASIAMGEEYYGNETFKFTPELVMDGKYATFRLNTEAYQYNVKNGEYHFDKNLRFKSKRAFDLVNINNDENDYFKAKVVDADTEPDTYVKYARATTPTGSASGYTNLYNVDPAKKYTYVFYAKTSDSVNCRVTFNCKKQDTDPDDLRVINVKMGGKIPISQVPTLNNDPLFDIPYFVCKEASEASLIGKEFRSEDDWKDLTVTDNMLFEAVYNPKAPVQQFTAKFINFDGTNAENFTSGTGYAKVNGSPYSNTIVWVSDEFYESPTNTKYNAAWVKEFTFDGWYLLNTNQRLEDTEITKDGLVFEPHKVKNPKITFVDQSGTQVSVAYTKIGASVDITDIPAGPVEPDMMFKCWKVISVSDPAYNSIVGKEVTDGDCVINCDTVFQAQYDTISTGEVKVLNCTVSKEESDQVLIFTFKIGNGMDEQINRVGIQAILPASLTNKVSEASFTDWRFNKDCVLSESTHTVTATSVDDTYNYLKIPNGGSMEVRLKVRCKSWNERFLDDLNNYQMDPSNITVTKLS